MGWRKSLVISVLVSLPVLARQAVSALKRAATIGKRYRLLLENAHDIVLFIRARDGCIVEANRAAVRAYGYSRAELLDKRISDLRALETHSTIATQMGQANTNGLLFETVHRSKDGSTFPVEVNSVGATFYGERILMSVIRDITARKQDEHEREITLRRMAELYENSHRIGLARQPSDMLGALLSNSALQRCSRATAGVFDQPWHEQDETTPAPTSVRILAEWDENPDTPSAVGREFAFNPNTLLRLRGKHQMLFVEDVTVDTELSPPLRDYLQQIGTRCFATVPLIAGGSWYGLLQLHSRLPCGINEDDFRHVEGLVDQAAAAIHNAMSLESEARAREEAERANELRLRFLAMISHELRTPLASIKGFASTLLAKDVTWGPEEQHEFIHTIDEEADKLTDMIDQILDLSRLEAGTLPIHPKPHSLDAITSVAAAQLNTLARQHTLVLDITRRLPRVNVDGRRIAQVLTNLIDNAVKYSPKGTTIRLSAKAADGYVLVSVQDQGSGIAAEERDYVFEAFRRGADRSIRNKKGAGLGLAICKGLVEAHGGKLWIEDHAGPGVTISFTLPVAAAVA